MRRERPVREHDPEWLLRARIGAAFWKMAALVFGGVVFQLALLGAREAAVVFGLLMLAGAGAVIAQSRRRPPP